MLTTLANNPIDNANNAPNGLLATNPPGYTRGRLAAEQAGGVVSSKGREQSSRSIIDDMTAETQAARDAFQHNTVAMDGKVYAIREPWEAVLDRAAAKFGGPAPDDEAMRFARALAISKGGK